jgi:hypothetical protein
MLVPHNASEGVGALGCNHKKVSLLVIYHKMRSTSKKNVLD